MLLPPIQIDFMGPFDPAGDWWLAHEDHHKIAPTDPNLDPYWDREHIEYAPVPPLADAVGNYLELTLPRSVADGDYIVLGVSGWGDHYSSVAVDAITDTAGNVYSFLGEDNETVTGVATTTAYITRASSAIAPGLTIRHTFSGAGTPPRSPAYGVWIFRNLGDWTHPAWRWGNGGTDASPYAQPALSRTYRHIALVFYLQAAVSSDVPVADPEPADAPALSSIDDGWTRSPDNVVVSKRFEHDHHTVGVFPTWVEQVDTWDYYRSRFQIAYRVLPPAVLDVSASLPAAYPWATFLVLGDAIFGSWTVQAVNDLCAGVHPAEGVKVRVVSVPLGYDETQYAGSAGSVSFLNLQDGTYTYTIGPDFDTPGHTPPGDIGTITGTFTITGGDDLDAGTFTLSRPTGCPPCDPRNAALPRAQFRELTGEHNTSVVSDTAVDTYLQAGLEELNRRLWYFIKSANIALLAGITEYPLPSDYLAAIYLDDTGVDLPRASVPEWQRFGVDWKGASRGYPREWAAMETVLVVNPPPATLTTTEPGALTLRYVGGPDAIADCGPEDLAAPEWTLCTFWAVQLWYSARRDSLSRWKAGFFKGLFEKEIAFLRPAYRERTPVAPFVEHEPKAKAR